MPAPGDLARTWTIADLEELPDDGLRYELVDGNLVVTPPTQHHTWVAHALAAQLRAAAPAGWRVVTELRLPMGQDLRIPDVVVHRWPLREPTPDPANPLGPRDVGLLVEVVSPRTRKTDRFLKPSEYATEGVPLFWRLETDPVLVLHPYALRGGSYVAVPAVRELGAAPAPWGETTVDVTALGGV
jgi:Uma2 family endonuclease